MVKPQILIVEDNSIVAEGIKDSLEKLGYVVAGIESSGERALKITEEKRPDLVLMDIVLKGEMDGIEAAENIRSRFGISVVFLTDYADEEKLERAKMTMPFGYLIKPFQDKELKATIEMALYKAKIDAQRKQTEVALQRAHDELEQRIAERTTELSKSNEQLKQEIKERKQAEAALQESKERFKRLYDNAPLPYQSLDEIGCFLEVNQTWLDMLGYSRDEVIGKSFADFLLPDWREHFRENFAKFKSIGKILGVEFEMRRKDGSYIIVRFDGKIGKDKFGNFLQTHCVFADITEQTHLKNKIRHQEKALRQAQKMESIGTLAGGIAHEFNNILGIIIGNTELAIDDVPEWNPAKECLKEIRAASMRAKDVVRHILSFARKTPVQRQPIQINTVMRDSLKLMRASIPTTIEIRQNISCESELILANPTEINQILMNLCTNSVHALSEETGVLEVSLESISLDKDSASQYENVDTGNFVKLTVKDTGEGIDPTIMDRVFDPYFTTKDIGKGTGMGLAIAYGIVKKYDGAIKATSELGIGTVVELLFPLIDERAEHEVKEEPEVLPAGTERILIVDDEPSMVRMVSQMLKRLGYEVVALLNPKEALELFMAEPTRFDLVITDMAMPHMAGDRFAQELMKIRQDIPVILCTGHSARIDEDRAKELGLAAYAMKPLVKRDFANTVRKVLDAAQKSTQE